MGRGGGQDPKAKTKTLQWGGYLYNVEHMEGKKHKDFPKFGDGCPTGGLQNQRGHRPML